MPNCVTKRSRPAQRKRTKPSCTAVAIIRPSAEKKCPVPSPLAPEALGELVSYSTHSSTRNGRWNHMA